MIDLIPRPLSDVEPRRTSAFGHDDLSTDDWSVNLYCPWCSTDLGWTDVNFQPTIVETFLCPVCGRESALWRIDNRLMVERLMSLAYLAWLSKRRRRTVRWAEVTW
jgi:hypothetical protein